MLRCSIHARWAEGDSDRSPKSGHTTGFACLTGQHSPSANTCRWSAIRRSRTGSVHLRLEGFAGMESKEAAGTVPANEGLPATKLS